MYKITILDYVTESGNPYNIPFYFSDLKTADMFEYYAANAICELYQTSEYYSPMLAVIKHPYLNGEAKLAKSIILDNFYNWKSQS